VYAPGRATAEAAGAPMDWITRDGKTSVLRATKTNWNNPRFSPDGQKVAVDIFDGRQRDIWVYEWARDTLTQLTFDSAQDFNPAWTPDGKRIVFASDRAKPGISNLYWVSADGTGAVGRLTDSPDSQWHESWHSSGKFLAFSANRGATKRDLMILPMEGDAVRGWTPGQPDVYLATPADEADPMFSPDGRWIAYSSDNNVYVRPFPGPGGPWRVTLEGGILAHWSASGRELLFLGFQSLQPGQPQMMFAPYAVVGDSFRPDKPRLWSSVKVTGHTFDVHPDGKRLATVTAQTQGQGSLVQDKVVFVFNFFEYLRAIAPGPK